MISKELKALNRIYNLLELIPKGYHRKQKNGCIVLLESLLEDRLGSIKQELLNIQQALLDKDKLIARYKALSVDLDTAKGKLIDETIIVKVESEITELMKAYVLNYNDKPVGTKVVRNMCLNLDTVLKHHLQRFGITFIKIVNQEETK